MYVYTIRILFVLFINLLFVGYLLVCLVLISEYLRFMDVGCRRHFAYIPYICIYHIHIYVCVCAYILTCVYICKLCFHAFIIRVAFKFHTIALTLLSCQLAWYENFIIQIFIHGMSTYICAYIYLVWIHKYVHIYIYLLCWHVLWLFLAIY